MNPARLSDLGTVYENVVTSILSLGGIVLFIMLLVAGFKYLTSGGDPKALEGAKKTLSSALTGLIMLIGSYLILSIIAKLTGTENIITNFTIFRQP